MEYYPRRREPFVKRTISPELAAILDAGNLPPRTVAEQNLIRLGQIHSDNYVDVPDADQVA